MTTDIAIIPADNTAPSPNTPTGLAVREEIFVFGSNSAGIHGAGAAKYAFDFYGAPTGVLLNRVYEVSDNEVILDALNEFPQIGVCDFEMVWDATGHYRGFRVFSPAKGEIKYNAVIDIDVNATTAEIPDAWVTWEVPMVASNCSSSATAAVCGA